MGLYRELLTLLVQANQAYSRFSGEIFHFDETTSKLLPAESNAKLSPILRWALALALIGELSLRIALIMLTDDQDAFYPKRVQIYSCVLLLFLCVSIGERYRLRGKFPKEYIEFLCGMFLIEAKYFKGVKVQSSVKIRSSKLFCHLSLYVCMVAIPLSLTLVSVVELCLPFNPVWFLSDQCNYVKSTLCPFRIIKVGFTIVVNFLTWETMALGGFCMIADILLGTAALVLCQRVILNKFSETVEKLSCILHPDPLPRLFKNEVVVYRVFQIVGELYNKCMRTIFFLFLVCCGVVQVLSASILIAEAQGNLPPVSWPLKMYFVSAGMETAIIALVVYGFPGDIFQDSVKGLDNIRKQINLSNVGYRSKIRKYITMFLASCPPMKIRLGLSNFIEKTTPPVFQMFCTCRVIDALLVK